MAILALAALTGPTTHAYGQVSVDESFQGTTAPGWILGEQAVLTAAEGIDADGAGWLRLAPASNNRAGYAYFDTPLPTAGGISVSFEYAMWGGTGGGDGISFFMFDGATDTFNIGAYEGSLGYAQTTTPHGERLPPNRAGLSNGYLGIGLDLRGDYSAPTDGRVGGPGPRPDSIAVRGAGSELLGYAYLAGTATLSPSLAVSGRPTSPADPRYRRVFVDLVPGSGGHLLTVRLQRGTTVSTILSRLVAIAPPTLKIGFAGSNGNKNNNHEVRLLNSAAPVDLQLTKSVVSRNETTITYRLTAANAGPNADPAARIVDDLATLANVSWACTGAGGAACSESSGTGPLDTTASLPAGGSATYIVSGTITGLSSSPLVNTATVTPSSSVGDSNPDNNTASASVQLTADLQISTTALPAYTPGLPHVYRVEVRNPGSFTVLGATVNDTLSPALPFTWSCEVITPPAICHATTARRAFLDALDLGAGAAVRYTLTIDVPADLRNPLVNVASVSVPDGWIDDAPANNTSTATSTAAARADVRVTKSSTPKPYVPGQSLAYTLVVGNDGPSDVVGARVADLVPPEFTGATWTCTSSNGGVCASTAGTGSIDQLVALPVGGSVTYRLSGTISADASSLVRNTVTVTPPAGVLDPVPGNNSATDLNQAPRTADLTISKSASPDPFLPGQPLTYRLVVINRGPADVTDARVQDVLPPGLATAIWTCVTSPSGSCATPAGTGSVDALVTLSSGSSATFTIRGVVAAGADTLVNTATVTAPPDVSDPVPGNNTARIVGRAPLTADLRIEKSSTPNPYLAGARLTSTVTVFNDGPGGVTNARVIDLPPADLADVTWTCASTGGRCATEGGVGHIDALVSLAAGANAVFTIVATAPPAVGVVLVDVATVLPPTTVEDPNPANNEAIDVNPVLPRANLVLTQTVTPNSYTPGGALTYRIDVTNDGPGSAIGARVRNPLNGALADFTWTCVSARGGASCGTPSGTGAIDIVVDLPMPAASVRLLATGVLDVGVTGTITNIAVVTSPPGQVDPNAADNVAVTTVTGLPVPDLGIVATTVPVATYRPGDPLAYAFRVTNHGTAAMPAGGYTVVNTVPGALSGATWTCRATPSGACGVSGAGQLVTAALPLLGPDETMVITLETVVPATATEALENTARVVMTAPNFADPSPANDTATAWLLPSPLAAAAIIGRVVDDDGAPLEGVVIQLTGAAALQATTAADGTYAFRGLAPRHLYEVSATSNGHTFTPAAHVFEALEGIVQADFVGLGQPYVRYYAEGSTGPFFTTTFSVTNPAPTQAVVNFRFQRPEATEITYGFVLAPRQSMVLDPSTLPGLEATAFSTVVESQHQIFTAREMHWDRSKYGTHRGVGVATPRTQWFIAEGATLPRFSLFYLLQNPGSTAATVTVRYLLQAEGSTPIVRSYHVEPRSRYTVAVHEDPALVNQELAAEISSDEPIVVDRAMYFSGPRLFEAGAAVTAVPTPSLTWYFSEGATGPFFDMFLLLANPNPVSVTATVRFVLPDGREALTREYDVPAGARRSVWIDQVDPVLADAAVAMIVEATGPIVAERSMWWPGSSETWDAGHASQGATTPAVKWGIGGLVAGGDSNAEPWVLVANPSRRSTTVRLTLYFPDGRSPVTADYPIAAESRLTIAVGQWHPETANSPFGAVVEQLDATTGIVVESAVYFDGGGVSWAAGRGGIATPIP